MRNIEKIIEYQIDPPYKTPRKQSHLSRSNFPGELLKFLEAGKNNSSLITHPQINREYSWYYRQVMEAVRELNLDTQILTDYINTPSWVESDKMSELFTRVFNRLCENGVPASEAPFG